MLTIVQKGFHVGLGFDSWSDCHILIVHVIITVPLYLTVFSIDEHTSLVT